jgi:lipocalin
MNILLLLFLSQLCDSQSLRGSKTLETVNDLNVNYYLGNWYQIYGAPTNVVFQGYGKCITAQYGLLENGNVSVLNSQINSNNVLEQIYGYAYYTNTSEPGKLNVHLDGVPVDSPYWVVKLGEVVADQYQYSIISVPSGISLWVLTRDIDNFYNLYYKEVKQYLDDNHFKYETIIQDDTCEYSFK